MPQVRELAAWLEVLAPPSLAESWDNVGLLVGDGQRNVERVMTCLTLAESTVREAIRERAELIVVHHPLPFRPINRLTTDTSTGRMLWELCGARISVYSPHTAWDSAPRGINQRLAEGLDLAEIQVLVPSGDSTMGAGRHGRLPVSATIEQLAARVKQFLKIDAVQTVAAPGAIVNRVALACGSAAEFIPIAKAEDCDCLVTGETRFHAALEAQALGLHLILTGHYASERFGVEALAQEIAGAFATLTVWASRSEADPLQYG